MAETPNFYYRVYGLYRLLFGDARGSWNNFCGKFSISAMEPFSPVSMAEITW
jgi:hypothetical protein